MSEENSFIEQLIVSSMYNLGDINGGLAHEINNPLTILVGQISLVKMMHEKGKLTPEQLVDKIGKIDDATRRVIDLVEKMRKIPRSVTEKTKTPTSLEKILNTNHFLIEYVCKKNNIELEINTSEILLDCIWEEVTVALDLILKDCIHHLLTQECKNKKLSITTSMKENHCLLSIGPFYASENFIYAQNILKRYNCKVESNNNFAEILIKKNSQDQKVA